MDIDKTEEKHELPAWVKVITKEQAEEESKKRDEEERKSVDPQRGRSTRQSGTAARVAYTISIEQRESRNLLCSHSMNTKNRGRLSSSSPVQHRFLFSSSNTIYVFQEEEGASEWWVTVKKSTGAFQL